MDVGVYIAKLDGESIPCYIDEDETVIALVPRASGVFYVGEATDLALQWVCSTGQLNQAILSVLEK